MCVTFIRNIFRSDKYTCLPVYIIFKRQLTIWSTKHNCVVRILLLPHS